MENHFHLYFDFLHAQILPLDADILDLLCYFLS